MDKDAIIKSQRVTIERLYQMMGYDRYEQKFWAAMAENDYGRASKIQDGAIEEVETMVEKTPPREHHVTPGYNWYRTQ